MSIFLSWENARGESTHPFFRLWMAHISTIFVHDVPISRKKVKSRKKCGKNCLRPPPRPPAARRPPPAVPPPAPVLAPAARARPPPTLAPTRECYNS